MAEQTYYNLQELCEDEAEQINFVESCYEKDFTPEETYDELKRIVGEDNLMISIEDAIDCYENGNPYGMDLKDMYGGEDDWEDNLIDDDSYFEYNY